MHFIVCQSSMTNLFLFYPVNNANSTLLLAQDQCVDEVKKYCLQIKSKANCGTA